MITYIYVITFPSLIAKYFVDIRRRFSKPFHVMALTQEGLQIETVWRLDDFCRIS